MSRAIGGSLLHGVVAWGLVLGLACGARSTIETSTEADETESCQPGTAVACFSGPAEARGVGACLDGERRCEDLESAVCEGEILPSVEDCGIPGNESCNGNEHACKGNVGWAISFGDGSQQYLHDVHLDASGDIVVVGAMGGSVAVGGALLQATGDWLDALVVKLSSDGSVLWARSFGDSAPQDATRVTTDVQGSVYLVGGCSDYASEGAWTFGNSTIECASTETGDDGYLAKLSADGEPLWIKKLGQTSVYAAGLALAPDGNLIVLTSAQLATSEIAKLDPEGTELWSVEVPDLAFNVAVGPEGNIVVTGDSGAGMFVETRLPSGAFVSRFEYPGVDWVGQQLAVDQDGELFLAGLASSEVQLQLATVEPGDLFAMRVSPAGEERWVHVVETTWFSEWTAVSLDALGNPLLAGTWSETIDPGLGPLTASGSDAFLVKLRGDNGNPLWQTSFGSVPEADSANAIASDGAHTHYVVGGFTSYAVTLGSTTLQNATQDGWAWDALVFQISE